MNPAEASLPDHPGSPETHSLRRSTPSPVVGVHGLARPLLALLVDDDDLVLRALKRMLVHRGFSVIICASGPEAIALLDEGLRPDIVFADHCMPGLSGVELLEWMRRSHPAVVRIGMSGSATSTDIVKAINGGAMSCYLLKPWREDDLDHVVAAAIKVLDDHRTDDIQLAERDRLVSEAGARDEELAGHRATVDALRFAGVRALASSIEARDPYTAGHGALVGAYAVGLGTAIGLAPPELERLRLGGLLHDIGKIGMPDAVLFKAGRLTADEITVMRTHPDVGMRILDGLHLPFDVLPIVRSHHERWDGGGYPDRTAGPETHHLARLVHVVDVYEALTARRIYREPMPAADIVEFFQNGRGTDFDPVLVDPFLQLLADGTFDRIRGETRRTVIQRPLSSVPVDAQ